MCMRRRGSKTIWLLALVAALWPTLIGRATGEQYDLVIRDGRIVDGTGNPWFYGDVAVREGRIVAIARQLTGTALRELDAHNLVIAPGFIDIHSHSDYLLLEDGAAQGKVRQGVTTEVLGEEILLGPILDYGRLRKVMTANERPAGLPWAVTSKRLSTLACRSTWRRTWAATTFGAR